MSTCFIKKTIIQILIFLLFCLPIVSAAEDIDEGEGGKIQFNQGAEISSTGEVDLNEGTVYIPENYNGVLTFKSSGTVVIAGQTYTVNAGDKFNRGTLETSFDNALRVEKPNQDGSTSVFSDLSNGEMQDNGNFFFENAGSISHDGITISNAQNVRFEDGTFTIEQADTIQIKDGLISQARNFEGNAVTFSIGNAQTIIHGGITLSHVNSSSVTINDDTIIIQSNDGEEYGITDSSFSTSEFSSQDNGTLIIHKDDQVYEVINGTLTCVGSLYNESIEATAKTIVSYGTQCMECASILPTGAYYYTDPIIEKDFVISIPLTGNAYRLCLRKDLVQSFTDAHGVVDFVDKKIDLQGAAVYKRYPLKNNKISEVLTQPMHEGKSFLAAKLLYEQNFIFLKEVSLTGLQNKVAFPNDLILSRTALNNYYSISEEAILGEKKRLLLLNWKLSRSELTQPLSARYASDGNLPDITITNHVLVQDNGQHSITVLEPDNPHIRQLVSS